MRMLGNLVWFVFGGAITGILWGIAGVLWAITVIGIPISKQCFKISWLCFCPFGKIMRFGDGTQKTFVINAEKAIQAETSRQTEIGRITEEATANIKQEEIATEEVAFDQDWRAESDESEEYYIDIACPYCHEELPYTNWQIKEGELICPMCDG